jgi:hypothetical protein
VTPPRRLAHNAVERDLWWRSNYHGSSGSGKGQLYGWWTTLVCLLFAMVLILCSFLCILLHRRKWQGR